MEISEEEKEEEEEKKKLQRVECRLCCPVNKEYPLLFLILFGNDIQLHQPKTLHRPTWIAHTTHPLCLLHSINQHPRYRQHPRLHKHLSKNSRWDFKLILGPFPPCHFSSTQDIIDTEKEWEQKARKVLTRLLWGITYWLQHKDKGLNCYIYDQDRDMVLKIMNHSLYSKDNYLNIKTIYDQLNT